MKDEKLDTEIFGLMYKIHKIMKERMDYDFGKKNITLSQFMAIAFINEKVEVKVKEVSQYLSIEMSTTTALLNKLDRLSLIKRLTDKNDRRVVHVSLTQKGKKILMECKKSKAENMKKMLSYLSDQQKTDMRNIFQTIVDNTK